MCVVVYSVCFQTKKHLESWTWTNEKRFLIYLNVPSIYRIIIINIPFCLVQNIHFIFRVVFFHYFVLFLFALCIFRFYVSVLEAAAALVDGILHAQNRIQDWMKNNIQKKNEKNRHIHSRCLLFFSFMYLKRLMRMCTLTIYISSPTHSHAVFHYNRKKKRISIFFCCLL